MDEQRRLVRTLAGFGVTQPDIAAHLGIDDTTLRRQCREELDRGVVEANTKVAQSLFQMATQGKNVAAAIFWMKSRGRWRERWPDESETGSVQVEIVRFGGGPIPSTPVIDQRKATPGPSPASAPAAPSEWSPVLTDNVLLPLAVCSTPTNDR